MQTLASHRAQAILSLLAIILSSPSLPGLAEDKAAPAESQSSAVQMQASKETKMPTKQTQAARLQRARQASKPMTFSAFFKPKTTPKTDAVPALVDQSQSHKEKKHIDLKPTVSNDPFERGKELAYRMKYDQALKYLDKAIEKDPNLAKAYAARAYAYEGLGQHEKAIADATRALTLDPTDPEPYGTRMRAYGACGQMQAGASDEKTVMHLEEMKVMQSTEKYLVDINKVIERDPQNGVHYIERANAYRGLHQFDKAIDDYTEAIKKDPNNYLAYFSRAQTYMAMKRKDLANRDFACAQQLANAQKSIKRHKG